VPYVEVDGQATTLGGEEGVIGLVHGPVLVQVGHRVAVKPARLGWPRATSSNPAVLKQVSNAGLGVFLAEKPGLSSLLMPTVACAHPAGSSCVLVDVVVTERPVATTAATPIVEPTTSIVGIQPTVPQP